MRVSTIVFVLLWFWVGFSGTAQTALSVHISTAVLQHEYKALHSYLLNDAAEKYADNLSSQIDLHKNDDDVHWRAVELATKSAVAKVNKYGASLLLCEYSGRWTSNSSGYFDYLSGWPDGPLAEEAWWRGKLGYRLTGCSDAAGTEEETEDFVHNYTEFLAHFPHGKHENEARALLKESLDSYKPGKNNSISANVLVIAFRPFDNEGRANKSSGDKNTWKIKTLRCTMRAGLSLFFSS
jgi:hypothetical protein